MSKIIISELRPIDTKSFLDDLNSVEVNTIYGGCCHSDSDSHHQKKDEKDKWWEHK